MQTLAINTPKSIVRDLYATGTMRGSLSPARRVVSRRAMHVGHTCAGYTDAKGIHHPCHVRVGNSAICKDELYRCECCKIEHRIVDGRLHKCDRCEELCASTELLCDDCKAAEPTTKARIIALLGGNGRHTVDLVDIAAKVGCSVSYAWTVAAAHRIPYAKEKQKKTRGS